MIKELTELRDRHAGKGWNAIRIQINASDDDYDDMWVVGERPETDAEMAMRIALEDGKDRREYERLKAKYEAK